MLGLGLSKTLRYNVKAEGSSGKSNWRSILWKYQICGCHCSCMKFPSKRQYVTFFLRSWFEKNRSIWPVLFFRYLFFFFFCVHSAFFDNVNEELNCYNFGLMTLIKPILTIPSQPFQITALCLGDTEKFSFHVCLWYFYQR